MIKAVENILADEGRLQFKYSRSGGPGGQNVNKLNTRVTLLFDVPSCPHLSEVQKSLILNNLATRIDKSGILQIVSQRFRTQIANRNQTIEKLRILLERALAVQPKRKKTRVPYAARQKRLRIKKHRSQLKRQRTEKHSGEDF